MAHRYQHSGHPSAAPRRAPIGVRGAPSGPRADLARADTSQVLHNIYVKVVVGPDPDRKSRDITLQTLKYVHSRLPSFAQMGLAVKVNKITSFDLQNARLVGAMKGRGIVRLPALTTPNGVYLGYSEIVKLYELNLKEFAARDRRGEKAVEGAAPEDALDGYYKDEMTFEAAEEDAQETGLGEADDMMDSYRLMMQRRETSTAGQRKPSSRAAAAAARPDSRAAPPRPPASTRPDNVGRAPRRAPADPDDAEIEATIDRLAQDIDDGVRSKAFSAGGGDSYDDDGGADVQDDLMERAFYGNQTDSFSF
jgi:hypothetical protein